MESFTNFIVIDLDNPDGEEFEDFAEAMHQFTKSVFWGNPATITYVPRDEG